MITYRTGWLIALGVVAAYSLLYVYSLANPGNPPDWRPDHPEQGHAYGTQVVSSGR